MKRLPCKPELARAIREDRKTETRRIMNPSPTEGWTPHSYGEVHRFDKLKRGEDYRVVGWGACNADGDEAYCARYKVGEIVGICEPWRTLKMLDGFNGTELVAHRAKCLEVPIFFAGEESMKELGRPRLARFLPDALVRTRVEITGVTAERLQDITVEQCRAEGCGIEALPWRATGTTDHPWRDTFASLWDSLHGKEAPWGSNPRVWRYTFRRTL